MDSNIIIVGAGIAGVQAATVLAKNGKKPILITNEQFPPYYRMRLEEVVTGAKPETIFMHPYSWYEENGITLLQDSVLSIDRDRHIVKLSGERELSYSKLIIASGSDAFSFPLGDDKEKVCVLRTMQDALTLRDKLQNANSLSIIGGGLLGLEAAAAISYHYKIKVSVIEGMEYILSKQLDRDSSKILKQELEKKGIEIIEGVSVSDYKENTLYLGNKSIVADLVLMSIGVRPTMGFLKDSGIITNRGIVVDNSLKTNDSDIYALGDVAELSKVCFSLAMYAREQGTFVANEIISGDSYYTPTEASSMLKVADIDIAFFGSRSGESIVYQKDRSYITCFVENGILNGVILINAKSIMMKAKANIGKIFEEGIFNL